jgi:hypothetical protein
MKKVVYVFFGWMLIVSGCDINQLEFSNLETPTIESSIALPIGEFTYSLGELVGELDDTSLIFEEDPETLLYSLVYNTTINYAANELDFIDIGDVTNSFNIPLPTTPAVSEATIVSIDTTFTLPFPANDGDALDSLIYASGTFDLLVSTSMTSVSHTLTIIDTRNVSGNSISFSDNSYPSLTTGYDLANHTNSLERVNGENLYSVRMQIEVNLGVGQSIPSGRSVSVSMTYSNQSFQTLFGNFGKDTIQFGTTSFAVDFFESLGGSGALTFRNPQINMTFDNSVGIPIGILFDEVYGVSDSTRTYLSGAATNSPQGIETPGLDQIGESVEDSIKLSATNSNLNEIFGNTPNEIVFNLSGVSNPFDSSSTNFFIPGSGQVDAEVEIRLPMEMQVNDLTRAISFDLADGIDVQGTDSITMRIVALNLLPFSTLMDVYFFSAAGDTLHQLDQSLVMATPFINIDFEADEAEPNAADIPLSSEGIEALADTRRIDVVLTLNTPESLNTREIYPRWLSRYHLTVKLSAIIKLNQDL